MLKKIVLWILVIFISAQIFSFSSDTRTESSNKSGRVTTVVVNIIKGIPFFSDVDEDVLLSKLDFWVRKTAHFGIYFILALSVFELARSYNIRIRYAVIIAAVYCLIYAISDEFHQLFVDGRGGQIRDVAIDFSGALSGLGIRLLLYKLFALCRKK